MVEEGPHREAREALGRAIRRLGILEYVILGVIVVLSLIGGALIAFLLMGLTGAPFRITWAVASILVFVVPGTLVWLREHRAEQASSSDVEPPSPTDSGAPSSTDSGAPSSNDSAASSPNDPEPPPPTEPHV